MVMLTPNHMAHRRALLIAVAGIVVVLVAGWVGWHLNSVARQTRLLRVSSTFTGRISYVSANDDAGCVTPDGGRRICSSMLTNPGRPLHIGQRVLAAHAWIGNSTGSHDTLIVYSNVAQ